MKKITLFLVSLMFACTLWAQNVQVSGVVTDTEGQPLPGVTVIIKGTKTSAITDANGRYAISAPSDAVLVFSSLGMKTREVAINGRTRFDVTLETESLRLDEVVVTAMGIKREKKSIGYAAQEVKAEELTITPLNDLNNALVGKVSGVRFWGASGATFDAGTIILRGTSALTNPKGNEPIYVVDGVITNVNAVNMEDVGSINVLKGPAATALYGSRGGNGAIIITSKGGSEGQEAPATMQKGTVEFSQSIMFENVTHPAKYQTEYGGGALGGDEDLMTYHFNPATDPAYLRALDGARYFDMENDISWGPRFDGKPYAPWYAWDPAHPKFGQTAPYTGQPSDNLKDLYRQGFTSTTNAAFSKAFGDFKTRVAFGNVARTGVMENSSATRRYFSINTAYNVNNRLSITADYKYTYRKNHNPAKEEYSTTAQDIMYSYTQWFHRDVNVKELRDYKRPDGTFNTWNPADAPTGNLTPMFHNNPFAIMNEVNRDVIDQWNVISGTVKYDIFKNIFSIGATVNANMRTSFEDYKVPYNIGGFLSEYAVTQNTLWDTQMQGFLDYRQRFIDDRLDVSARLFAEQRDRDYRYLHSATDGGLTFDKYFNLAASINKPNTENSESRLKERSIFGTGIIGWDNTYYLDFSLRNDWSSTLPKDANSYLYGGLSVSVITSNFLPGAKWLDFWKVRGSLAQVGSTLNPYQVEEIYTNLNKYGNLSAMRGDAILLNPHIKPTISTSYEVGTEFRLFDNRLYGDVNYYIKDAKDQIINLTTAPVSGYTATKINAGKIRNEGYEITVGGAPIRTKDFQWDIYANYAHNKNTLLELDPNDPGITQYRLTWRSFSSTLYMFAEVGQPIGVIRGSTYDKSPDGRIVYVPRAAGHPNGECYPLRKTTAQENFGNVQPDATGGFGTSFNYKGFRLSFAFDFQLGGQVASITNMFGEGSGLLESTVGTNDRGGHIRSDVWNNNGGVKVSGVTRTGSGPTATYTPYEGYMDAYFYYAYKSTLWEPYIYDASYLKMRELSLTYTVPASFLKKLDVGISKASLAFNMQNPWLLYSGVPNVDASDIGNSWNGYMESGQVLSTRSWGFTLNLTF